MKKLLITGASGFLGWYLCRLALAVGWEVHGIGYTKSHDLASVLWHRLDLTDDAATNALLNELRPDAVIHAAAMGRPNDCQTHPQDSFAINVLATENLVSICKVLAVKLVFISTEQVFDGEHAPYRECDAVSPINIYGEHKAIAEQKVLDASAENLVCRMPLMFGVVPSAPSFLQGWVEQFQKGEILKLFTDEIRTPLNGEDAAKGILLGLRHASGTLHLGGPESLSRYDMGLLLLTVLGLSPDLVSSSLRADVPMSAPRPMDLTMNYELAASYGYAPTSMKEKLKDYFKTH